jgi:hypothetical protein
MTLDQDFYQTMLSVMQRRARGEAVDYRTEVIDVYGTHFPYAVTSGSVARNQLEYTKEMAAELAKSGSSVDVHASATIRGVEGGGKFSKDDSLSDKFNSSLELQVEKFDKVGDATIPVPVFMDLRPLDRLLDVAFFGNAIDPKVGLQPLGLVARELRAAIEAYLQAQAPKYDKPEDIWEIYAYSMNFDRLEFDLTVKDLSDLDAVAGQVAFDPLFRGRTPIEIRKWSVSDPIVLVGDNPFQKLPKAMSIDLPDTGQYRIVTAQEYCSQKPLLTAFAWGVRMNRVFRGLGGNALTDDKAEQERFTYLKDLGTADTQEADNFVIARRIQGRLTVSARRIPGNQGQLRPLPDCH